MFEHAVVEVVDTLQKMLHKAIGRQNSRKHDHNIAIENGLQQTES